MGASMAEQLQNALKRAQEKTGNKTPEGTALGILREELSALFASTPAAPAVTEKQAANLALGRRKSMPRVWMEQAKLGETFYDVPARNPGTYWGIANELGCKVSTERCLVIVGQNTDTPQTITATKLTLVEKDGKTLPKTGPDADGDKNGSDSGVAKQSAKGPS